MKYYTKYGWMNQKQYDEYIENCRKKAIKELQKSIEYYTLKIDECKKDIKRYELKEIY